ncbi:MAG: hypothetical protein J5I90_00825 [Caldilineales bacterium]|nr:hypothetical protein [Caldilineales bacterium]
MRRRFALLLALVALVVACAGGGLVSQPVVISGQVRDADGPVAGATVRQRATASATTSDGNGHFELALDGIPLHKTVTAWADGYYIAAADVSIFRREVELELRPHTDVDHPGMDWLPSDADPNVELACANCHQDLHADWRADAHSQAANNPLVQAMYTGDAADGRKAVGPGFRLDEPDEPGNCAFCHAPAAASLDQLEGEAANGVFCQFCHSVAHAERPYAETTAGVKAISLLRPPPGEHLFIGPYDDVPGRDTFSALQQSSQFCAACHSGSWWDVPTYTSFDEWQASAYAAEGVECQDCHMASTSGAGDPAVSLVSACAPDEPSPVWGETLCKIQACIDCHITGEVESRDPTTHPALIPARDPATVSNHFMRGSRDPDFLRQAINLKLDAYQSDEGVLAEVSVANVGAGHHMPTDGWMRNMVLLVSATDAAGQPLAYRGWEVVPAWGGEGAVEQGNYAGQPGRVYARVLEDWEGESPAPPWRNGVAVISDTRIPAQSADDSTWLFAPPADGNPAQVTARLIYRRAFKPWTDVKGWELDDIVLAETTLNAIPADFALPDLTPPIEDVFSPSAATTSTGQRIPDDHFTRAQTCGECHQPEMESWMASGHSASASGPLYQAWFKVANENTNGEVGAFCAGCHAPIGLVSGQIRSRWGWVGQENSLLSETALEGVSCDVCHAVAVTTAVGDGGIILDGGQRSGIGDQRSGHGRWTMDDGEDAHRTTVRDAAASGLLSKPEFCAACHQAENAATGLTVMSTYDEWSASPYNSYDPGVRKTCQDCHFADGRHGRLTPDDLASAAAVEILPPDAPQPGEAMTIDVRVSNVGAGHSLPTGVSELRQMWLSLVVTAADGREIFRSGDVDDFGDPLPGSVTYGVDWLDAEGEPTNRQWEAASVAREHRIPAAGSTLERFSFPLPDDVTGPLHIAASLNYRNSAGYLSALMSVYLQDEILASPTIELAGAETQASIAAPID